MEPLNDLVVRAQAGDLEAFGRLVRATQTMVHAVAREVLRHSSMAEDAAQEAYLRAFRRLRDLEEPAAFVSWLRRIVITVALNMRRAQRFTLLRLDDAPDVPVLDEAETSWSELQRQRLAEALLTLTTEERQLCDRRYHGHWSTARLAEKAGVDEPAMRKRLQRIRDKLRKEMEVAEQRGIRSGEIRSDFPAHVVELLARPRLTDLPENPVGRTLELLRTVYADFAELDLTEIVDFAEARKTIGDTTSSASTRTSSLRGDWSQKHFGTRIGLDWERSLLSLFSVGAGRGRALRATSFTELYLPSSGNHKARRKYSGAVLEASAVIARGHVLSTLEPHALRLSSP